MDARVEKYTAEQYREMSADELEARRADILSLADEPGDESVEDIDAESRMCAAEYERRNRAAELRSATIRNLRAGAGRVVERTGSVAEDKSAPAVADPHDTPEYRNAFMDYVKRGVAFPMELRADEYTATSDVAPQVPTTMGRLIVQKMSEYGTIWQEVQKLNVKGGLWFRVVDLSPTASWIDEDSVSDTQKVTSNKKVSFSFYQLECRIAQTLLASAVTFEDFQALFVPKVAEAMVRALEQAIVRGDGNGKPLGIVNDASVTNVVEMSATEFADWKQWHKKVKAAMPKAYRNGGFIMAQSTWDTYVETMSDDQNAPVSIGYNPVTGEEVMRLMGKKVDTVETDILPDFDQASVGDVVAIFGDLKNYAVNTQPGMPLTVKRWVDDDHNLDKTKALMACDGKVLDPYGFILIKKKANG